MIEPQDVPEDWELKTIEEITSEIRTGGTPARSNERNWGGDIPWKASKHFNRYSLKLEESKEYVTEEGKSESTMAHENEPLLVCRGAHTGKVGVADEKILFNQDVKVIRTSDSVMSKYIAYYLMSNFDYFKNVQRGGTTKGITTSQVKSLSIPIPSLDEQIRIVESIEERLDRIKILKRSVENVDRLADEYDESLVLSLMSGGIEKQPSVPPENGDVPEDWEVVSMEKVAQVETGGTPKTGVDEYWGGDITWIRVSDMPEGMYVSESEDKITQEGLREGSCSLIQKGGVVLSTRATIGEVAIADEKMATNQGFKSIIPESNLEPEYLAYYLDSITDYLESLGRGATYDEINKTQVQNIQIPLPPSGRQKEIVEKIESFDSERLRVAVESVGDLFSEYRESILSYAFQGKMEY